jgi:acetyl-CoA synthetase
MSPRDESVVTHIPGTAIEAGRKSVDERWPRIVKPPAALLRPPNLSDYASARREFAWRTARAGLTGLPDGRGLNIAFEAVDRHAASSRASQVALRWLAKDGRRRDITYATLGEDTSRFANVLARLEIRPGDPVAALLGRVPALYVAALGTLKHRAVFLPLFSAFGPEPIQARLEIARARVLITTPALYQRKVAALRARLPHLEHVLLITDESSGTLPAGTTSLTTLLRQAASQYTIDETSPDDPALLHFTSGTTGRPKGAVHVHDAVVAHHETARVALDFHAGDIFWCTADPGWVTGTSYGIIAPLTHGLTSIIDEADFDAERWYRIIQDERVTVWYSAPTAIRMLMKVGADVARRYDLGSLRFLASVGEPLNPEAVVWSQETFGRPFHDNWWQTETGGIMIANFAAMDIRPGSMGRPLPGIDAAVVRRMPAGGIEALEPGVDGELALRPGWPSMFRAYLGETERYQRCFAGGFYLTGDVVRQDRDGYFWFVGRADDLIKSSGHLIGPFEVESVLLEHPAVAEAGVIGKPDPVALEIVKAFVALKPGFTGDEALRRDLLAFARTRLGAAVAPKEIDFRTSIPRNRAGKIMRRLLKAQELGLPEGDVSTLESNP